MTSASSTRSEPEFFSNFCTAARVRGRISPERLERALDLVRARHILLIPDSDSQSPRFPLRFLENCDDGAWKEIVKQELLTPFAGGRERGPFARFTLLQTNDNSDLVGTFHHGVCDGLSGVYVLRDILHLLGDPATSLPPLPAPPHLAPLIPEDVARNPRLQQKLRRILLSTRVRMVMQRLSRWIAPGARRTSAGPGGSAEDAAPNHLRMHILTHTLTAPHTDRMIQRCKAAGVTVHAAVCSAWLRAFAGMLRGPASRTRSVSSPVSLRGRLTQPVPETAGLFLSTVETSLHCKPGRGFWETAGEFQTRFREDTADENLFLMPLTIGAFFRTFSHAELGAAARIFFDRPVRYDFSITNLGRLDIPSRIGSLQVESVHNLVNSSEHERTVGVNTFDGRLTFILMFREAKMTLREGEQLMSQAVHELADASDWQV